LVRRAPRRTRPAEAGFTLIELAVTMMVMGIVATAVIAVAMRTFTTTATITNRRDVLADGRIALDRVSKQLRQGEWVDQTGSTPSSITFSGYIDGEPQTIVWKVTGTSAPYTLQESQLGGANLVPILSSLTNTNVFTYTSHGGVVDQVTVSLSLGTETSTILLSTDVELRNAQA
jgi:prepilin-type N-terminal cleavage/methylation domain-containing protein